MYINLFNLFLFRLKYYCMSEEHFKSTLHIKGGNVEIEAQHNKKFQCAVLFVEFNTSQKDLLCLMLQKYIEEKRLATGLNLNNAIYAAIPGETSIVLFVPENKICNNIALLVAYLHKSHLTSQQAKFIKSGDYDKLSSDIKAFNVIVTGKCKTFIAALKSNATKITNLTSQLSAIEPKARESFTTSKITDSCFGSKINFDGSSANAKLYTSILLEDIPAKIDSSGITFLCTDCAIGRLTEKLLFKDVLQGKVKSFLTQTGAVGTPAANDTGGAKFKAKAAYILDCENCLAKIFSKLRGFNYSFSSAEDLKKVDSAALAKVKAIKV